MHPRESNQLLADVRAYMLADDDGIVDIGINRFHAEIEQAAKFIARVIAFQAGQRDHDKAFLAEIYLKQFAVRFAVWLIEHIQLGGGSGCWKPSVDQRLPVVQ